MSGRYQELFRIEPRLYMEGSPIIIEAGALQKDNVTNEVLAQIKYRNISEKRIVACKVSIKAYETNGNEVEGVNDFSYLDIDVPVGGLFGAKIPVYLPNSYTRRFSVAVIEVVFNDGTLWNANVNEWVQVPKQLSISEVLKDNELVKQYELEVGKSCYYYPQKVRGLYLCTCGAINLESNDKCYECKREYNKTLDILNEEVLSAHRDERLKREAEEKAAAELAAEKAAEEAKIKREERNSRRKKHLKILIPVLIIVCIVLALTPTVIIPEINNAMGYKNAKSLLASGSYDDAKSVFEELGKYRDSANMVLESMYQKAEHYYSEEDYENAIKTWTELGDYSDCEERIKQAESDWKESDYQSAITAVSNGDYENALKLLKSLEGYKDSSDQYISTCYSYACKLSEDGSYKKAIDYFEYSRDYKDSKAQMTEAIYNYGCEFLSKKDYQKAIDQFKRCSSYKDTESLIADAKYGYASTHKSSSDTKTHSYLKDLVKDNYPGAKTLYDEIYEWKIKITAVNSSEDSEINMSSVSRYDTVYFHYEVTGGAPGESEVITMKGQLPRCSAVTYTETVSNGYTGTFYIYYTYGNATGTASASFYDSKGNKLASASIPMN